VTAPSEPVAVPAPATAFVPSTPGWRYELNRAIDVRLAPFEVHTPAWHGHLNDATNALLGTEAVR
jgi:hypothetical protein